MVAKEHRFHGYGSLRPVYRRGQNLRGALINLKFARRDPGRPYRVAVVVSRKVSKSAVTRNRIRRRIYETVRRTDTGGVDLVFTVFSDRVAELAAPKLSDAVGSLLREAAT